MKKALAALPWVEYRTIEPNSSSREVKFGVNHKPSFSEDNIRNALPSRYRDGLEVVTTQDVKQ